MTADLARLFAGSPALAGVSLRVEAGRTVALLGPNGAGKTTLLRLLATVIRPSFGSAEVDGYDLDRHADLVRERVAYLSHAAGLYDDLSAHENLRFAAAMLGTPEPEERVERALADVGLASYAAVRVRGFSAGMRRRLALARVLLGNASVVLLDEPYAALDGDGLELVDRLLDAWHGVGVTILVASHATDRLAAHAHGRVVLERGLVTDVAGEGVWSVPPALPARGAVVEPLHGSTGVGS